MCESCGKPKCNCGKDTCSTGAAVVIKNATEYVNFRKVLVPASVRSDETDPPKPGEFCNVLLVFEATGNVYLYSSDKIPTFISSDLDVLKEYTRKLVETEATARETADEELTKAIAREIETRADADSALREAILQETLTRHSDDETLQGNIDAEASTRADADRILDGKIEAETAARGLADTALSGRIDAIEEVIPNAATAQNQLADKNFVNSSIATNTAYYISDNGQPFASLADLQAYSGDLTNNDYAFVVGTDQQGNTTYTRYKYNADTQQWAEEYVLNNSSFTANQWAAINSGITSGDVIKISTLADIQTIGANLTLTNGELSATDTTYTAGTGITIDANNVISSTASATLYSITGQNTDGAMTQKATTDMIFTPGYSPESSTIDSRIRIGYNASSASDDGIALGRAATATQSGSGGVAIGYGARVETTQGVAIGTSATTTYNGNQGVAIGGSSVADGLYSVALGFGSSTGVQDYVVSVGEESLTSNLYRRIVNVADATATHDAVTKGQLDAVASTIPAINNVNSNDWSNLWQ